VPACLEDDVAALPAGELADLLDALLTALRDDVVVAGAEHVGQREQRRDECGVLGDRQLDQGAVGQRDTHGLALGAVDVAGGPEPAADARGVQALAAVLAGPVGVGERRDDQVALLHDGHVGAGVLDHAEELVPHSCRPIRSGHGVVRVQVAAADAGPHHADQGVGGLLDDRIRDVLDTDVAGCVHERCSHEVPCWRSGGVRGGWPSRERVVR
jgi:hypothetical protein